MRALILAAGTALVLTATPAASAPTEDEVCTTRQSELAKQAETFQGELMIKRLIAADLQRASREQAEGDAEECIEALDHAAKLLAGDY